MNIGIAANYLLFEQAGIGKYTQNLLKNLFNIDPPAKGNQYFLYFSFLRRRKERLALIKERLGKIPANVKIIIFPIPAAWMEYLLHTRLPLTKYLKEKLDVFFSPYVSLVPKRGFPEQKTKILVTIHDLVFLRYPSHRGRRLSNIYRRWHQDAIAVADKIIVPSKATKLDLQRFLNPDSNKIVQISEAADASFRPIKSQAALGKIVSKYFDPAKKYILFVGTLEPRKNLSKLVEAFSMLSYNTLREFYLVIVGAKGWNNDAFKKTVDDFNISGKIILPGFVEDRDLPYIYNKATIFVYPSLYEGFGLPVLEAAACGVPIIASDTSSIPEVIGDAAILVDPSNEIQISTAIKTLLSKEKLRQKLGKKGILKAKKYSWAKTAQRTLDVFKSI